MDVVEGILRAVDGVVRSSIEALRALPDQCDLFVYHCSTSFTRW